MKYYICKRCGNIVELVEERGGTLVCCNQPMEEMVANTVDASFEKHIPVYIVEEDRVRVEVGSIPHPMTPEHHIAWIELKTKLGTQRKYIKDKTEAKICFKLCKNDELLEVYAYCNLHGFWKK